MTPTPTTTSSRSTSWYTPRMSCISAIQTRLTPEQLARAEKQKFKYSSPRWRASLGLRLESMAKDSNPLIRAAAASHYRIPIIMQLELAGDRDPVVRRALASNPSADGSTLFLLAHDDDEETRGRVALNTPTSDYLLNMMSYDYSEVVRALVKWRTGE